VCLDIQEHLWDSGGSETYDHKGQVGEEEIHGPVQVDISDYGQDDE
jgi:hypothetical protein